jgi:hypothetical protein
MDAQPVAETPLPFAAEKDSREFLRQLMRCMMRECDARQRKLIPVENMLVFCHGRGWTFQQQGPQGYSPGSGSLELQRLEGSVQVDRILANDATVISDFLHDMANAAGKRLEEMIFEEMKAAAEESGNAIPLPKDGRYGDALLQMIKRTELPVRADGTVSRPQLFLQPGMLEKIVNDLAQRGLEFEKQADALWKEKEDQALAREKQRLARYDSEE